MDVKTIGLIFLGVILIQASVFGVVADKIPHKHGEVPKLAKEGNHLKETAAVRALSLNSMILKKRLTREGIKENKEKKGKFVYIDWPPKNWADARAECKKRGGDLPTHLTRQDLEFIQKEIIEKAHPNAKYFAWIGGRMYSKATSSNYRYNFEWIDGDRIAKDDKNWGNGGYQAFSIKCLGMDHFTSTRKDWTRGPSYITNFCRSLEPYLCQV